MDTQIKVTDEVLEKINVHTVKPLSADEVYCFSVILCDNEVDRDFEKFSRKSLEKLSELYIGRTGIFDHNPKGENQNSRIFDTAIKEYPEAKTTDGETYTALIGYAYMVRTEDNKSLIAEIDGGIKKEVSVSCRVSKSICNICGADEKLSPCVHQRGKTYGEKFCYKILEEPTDAYEWSFVAVPAQRNAGVTKKYTAENTPPPQENNLEREKLNKACEELRGDILRLSYFVKPFFTTKSVCEKTLDMDFYQLVSLKKSLEKQVSSQQETNDSFVGAKQENNNDDFKM